MEKKGLASIIVLNWNGIGFTKQCLYSIKNNTLHKPVEVIVVDNGSDENNVRALGTLKKNGLIDRLILNRENKGFAFANNQGFDTARGEYLFMLNNDTLVTKGWLLNAVKLMQSSEKMAAVGCRLVDLLPYRKKNFAPKPDRAVKTTCGAAMLISKKALKRVGKLDAKHFSPIYGEETDWCYRARSKGYKIMETGKSIVVHLGSQDTKKGRGKEAAFELLNTHRLKAMLFNLSIPQFLGHVPGLGLIFVNAAKDGMLAPLLKSYLNNAMNAGEIMKERGKRKARLF